MSLRMVHPKLDGAEAEVVDEATFDAVWAPLGWTLEPVAVEPAPEVHRDTAAGLENEPPEDPADAGDSKPDADPAAVELPVTPEDLDVTPTSPTTDEPERSKNTRS